MVGPALRRMTLAEFLEWDDGTDTRYELFDGEVFAMAPPLVAHALIVPNIVRAIGARLKPRCRVFSEVGIAPAPNRRDAWYQADVVVSCADQATGARYLSEPALVVEVLSPSTTDRDHGIKARDYRAIVSVREIVFVSTDRRHVAVWRRAAGSHWQFDDFIGEADVPLETLTGPLALGDIYDGVAGL